MSTLSDTGVDTAQMVTPAAGAPLPAVGDAVPHRRRGWVLAGIAVLVVAGVVLAVTDPFASSAPSHATDNQYPTALATVSRQTITSQTSVGATLGFTGSYSVVNQMPGTLTWLPAMGQVVSEGGVLYRIDNTPVVLLYGATPVFRTLALSTSATPTTGPDVEQLNNDLVAMGYDGSAGSDEFTSATAAGVSALQGVLGLPETGSLTLGQAVFLPAALRITSLGNTTLGSSAGPGTPMMSGTSTARVVTVDLDADQQGSVAVGDHVTITLPDNSTTPGVVTSVGSVASSSQSGGTTVTVLITPTDPSATGHLDQAPVQVAITTGSAADALVVPVNALLALSTGGYAVEVAPPEGAHRLIPVSLGLFDDAAGVVQVTGPGLAAGQKVVVPGSA